METLNIKDKIKEFINTNFESKTLLNLFIILLLTRIIFIFLNPFVTSDLLRNIFYGENFWIHGLRVYDYTPLDMDPNYNILDPLSGVLSWEKNMYDYPVLHLLFFAFISLLPFPVLVAKTIFTIFDLINFSLINRNQKFKKIAWFYLIISSFMTSLEGQVVSITVFLFILGITLYESGSKRLAYFLSAIGFQWKIVGILLFPFYAIKDLFEIEEKFKFNEEVREYLVQGIIFIIPVTILSIIPLIYSRYLLNSQFFTGFLYDVEPWNVLYLPLILPSGILLALTMLFILIVYFRNLNQWKKGLNYLLLLELGIFFLLIYKFAMPWAWLFFIPGYLIIRDKELPKEKEIGYLLIVTFILACFDFLNLTIGFDNIGGLIQHFIDRLFG
jgi:hypothetical protein